MKHLSQIRMRPFDVQNLMGIDNSDDIIQSQAKMGTSYTAIDNEGNIIAIGGMCIIRIGVGAPWVITSDLFVKYKVWIHKAIKNMAEEAIKIYNLHRLETAIVKEHEVSHRWAERLGFEREGLMRKFDQNKKDYYLYARII